MLTARDDRRGHVRRIVHFTAKCRSASCGAVLSAAILRACCCSPDRMLLIGRAHRLATVIKVREWRATHERQIVAELMQLVALPNIASNKADIVKNADVLTGMFEKRGFTVKRIADAGLAGADCRAGCRERRRHADVLYALRRPADRSEGLDASASRSRRSAMLDGRRGSTSRRRHRPRSIPTLRIYGRAVADDKGPIIAFLAAIDGLVDAKAHGAVDVARRARRRRGSGLAELRRAAMTANAARVRARPRGGRRQPASSERPADRVLRQPRRAPAPRSPSTARPAICTAATTATSSPIRRWRWPSCLASMKDDRGNVTIKRFYDDVVPLTASERRAIDEIPNVDQKLLEQFGVAQSEHPDSRIELQHNRPTLSVVGLQSGTVGAGARNAMSGHGDRPRRDAPGERPEREDATRSPDGARPRPGLLHRRCGPPDMATRRKYPKIARVTQSGRRVSHRQGHRWTIRAR